MCLSSDEYTFKWNGTVDGCVVPARGLRQGDLISLYLNLLCAEAFSSLLRKAADEQLIRGARVDKHEKYLGLLTIIGRSKRVVFNCIKERIWKKMQGWKGKLLSQAGREVLIKSVAQEIPTYMMGVFKIPDGILDEIHSILVQFCDFISSLRGHDPSYVWRSIRGAKSLLLEGLKWRVGNGESINVLDEAWLPGSYSTALPTPNLESTGSLRGSDLMYSCKGEWDWDQVNLHLIEGDATRVRGIPLSSRNLKDIRYWWPTEDGIYTIKSRCKPCQWEVLGEGREAMAARFGVNMAKTLGHYKIELECDASGVVKMINQVMNGRTPLDLIVEDVREVGKSFEAFECYHVKRCGNIVAHLAARLEPSNGVEQILWILFRKVYWPWRRLM
ncbi:uncharacterized protein LOC110727505 [Chenopodium quinoa]|uniref:uncharacterized protein LOC110727505 n=1 Tax=Chenopodium quinoa TaxID=63459 RepID=UPI000B7831F8|nr:uncharacterized protein LOC110727505 [Chenopodium quinoa]